MEVNEKKGGLKKEMSLKHSIMHYVYLFSLLFWWVFDVFFVEKGHQGTDRGEWKA